MGLTVVKDHVKIPKLVNLKSPVLIVGPAHSGKSELAHSALNPDLEAAIIGTGETTSSSAAERTESLKRARSKNWETFENVQDLAALTGELIERYPQVLVDSLNQYIAGRIALNDRRYTLDQLGEQLDLEIQKFGQILKASRNYKTQIVLISSEVGAGISPPNSAARLFRKLNGRLNTTSATLAASVVSVTCGIPQIIKAGSLTNKVLNAD